MIHNGVMTLATVSKPKPKKGGDWYQANSKLTKDSAILSGSQGELEFNLPKAKELKRFVWNSNGVHPQ